VKTGRRRALVLLLAVVLVLGTGAAAALFLPHRIERGIDGGGSVTIELPWSAGTPAVQTLPPTSPAELPLATLPLTRPVRIAAGTFLRQADLTFSYAGLDLPAGVDPAEDITVFTLVPELGVWLPVDTTVDAGAATAAVSTPHFSDWVLGVTDPDVLRDQKALADRLKSSAGGALARITYGSSPRSAATRTSPCCPSRSATPPRSRRRSARSSTATAPTGSTTSTAAGCPAS
jgi:hypothetical protein